MLLLDRVRRWVLACCAVLLLLGPAAVLSEEDCLKLVFELHCLGGDLNASRRQGPKPQYQQTDGERVALIFQDGPEQVYVIAFRNRIYKVVRRYPAATQLRFDELYGLLRGTYGPGEDESRFPPYASTPSRRLGSIRRGDGQAIHVWKPYDTWRIELSWTRELGLAVTYVATALDEQQKAAVETGF